MIDRTIEEVIGLAIWPDLAKMSTQHVSKAHEVASEVRDALIAAGYMPDPETSRVSRGHGSSS